MRRATSTLDAPDPDRDPCGAVSFEIAHALSDQRNLPPPEFSPPRCGSSRSQNSGGGRSFTSFRPFRCVPPSLPLIPAITAFRKEIHHATARSVLAATGRRLPVLGKVISHFFRKGKLGLKLAIKIPFFVETDWNRRP